MPTQKNTSSNKAQASKGPPTKPGAGGKSGPGGKTRGIAQGQGGFISTGPKIGPMSKVRTKRVTNFPVRRRPLDPEEKKRLAQQRWKKAIRKVRAMLKFNIKIVFKDMEEETTPVNLAPTYKMTPDPGKKFNSKVVECIMENVLQDRLKEYEYSRFTAPKFAKALSGMIIDRVREMDFPRYKFITNVIMTENANQCLNFTSRCVWDTNTDAYATYSYKKGNFVAIATVHGVYLD